MNAYLSASYLKGKEEIEVSGYFLKTDKGSFSMVIVG